MPVKHNPLVSDAVRRRAAEGRGSASFLVFGGVDWEAEVWLNGKPLGSHKGYFEPFRFDVTGLLKENNTLAVRVIDGPRVRRAAGLLDRCFRLCRPTEQRYVLRRGRVRSAASSNGDLHVGSGFGIHREVYSGDDRRGAAWPRSSPAATPQRQEAAVAGRDTGLPDAGQRKRDCPLGRTRTRDGNPAGEFRGPIVSRQTHAVACREGRRDNVTPCHAGRASRGRREPCLYRCRVSLSRRPAAGRRQGRALRLPIVRHCFAAAPPRGPARGDVPAQRPAALPARHEHPGPQRLLVLGRAGTAPARRAAAEGGQLQRRPLLPARRVSRGPRVVRPPGHDVGAGPGGRSASIGIAASAAAAHPHRHGAGPRQCYNNPGVVLLVVRQRDVFRRRADRVAAALAVDPQRIFKPISGNRLLQVAPTLATFPRTCWANVIDDGHPYSGWYGGVGPQMWSPVEIYRPRRLVTLGEYGAEALDAYETMRDHYPPQCKPRRAEADTLWAASQVAEARRRSRSSASRPRPGESRRVHRGQPELPGRRAGRQVTKACGSRRGRSPAISSSTSSTWCRSSGRSRSSATISGRRRPTTRWPRSTSRWCRCSNCSTGSDAGALGGQRSAGAFSLPAAMDGRCRRQVAHSRRKDR